MIGVANEHFGEIPVAIIKTAPGTTISKADMIQRVMHELGPESELNEIYTLDELSLDEFPLNPTGKVMKASLKAEVMRLRRH